MADSANFPAAPFEGGLAYWVNFRGFLAKVQASVADNFLDGATLLATTSHGWPWGLGLDPNTGLSYFEVNTVIAADGQTYEVTPAVCGLLAWDPDAIGLKVAQAWSLKRVPPPPPPMPTSTSPVGAPMTTPRYFWPATGDDWKTGSVFKDPATGVRYYKGASLAGPFWYQL